MGSSTNGTGVWALLQSGDKLGVFPRLITVPGYTSQMANSVETITITTVGKGYVPGTSYLITCTAGGVSPTIVQARGHAVANADGEIHQTDLVLDTLGAFYTEAPTVAIAAPPEPVAATLTGGLGGGNVLSNLFIGTRGPGLHAQRGVRHHVQRRRLRSWQGPAGGTRHGRQVRRDRSGSTLH